MTFENRNLRCRGCRFWWPIGEATGNEPVRERAILGQCRRYAPPAAVADLPDHTRHYPFWATTKRDDWCGDHEHMQQ
jgi:hypothetical protein